MTPLFVYGTLRPGQCNACLLENIGGEWQAGIIHGKYFASGRGAAAGFPGVVLDPQGAAIEGFLFFSEYLHHHWQRLDEFEDGYDRVMTEVTTADQRQVSAWVYQLQPGCV